MTRASRFLFPLFFLPLFADAQPLPDRVPLAGIALDGAGQPLRGALISLRRQENSGPYTFWGATTESDARGAWRFERAEAGRYYLSAEAPGFAPLPNQSLDWKAGAAAVRLQFQRLVNLNLQVRSLDNTSLAQTPLYLRLRDESQGQTTRRALTDSAGNASFEGLMPGVYALYLATPRGYAIQNGLDLLTDKTLDLTLSRGGALAVRAVQNGGEGQEANRTIGGATLSLTPENSSEAVRALGSSGDMNENLALLAARGDATTLVSRDGDGEIGLFDVPPGRYLARLQLPGFAPSEPRVVLIEAGQTANLEFALTPAPSVTASSGVTPKLSSMAALTLDLRLKDASGTEKSAPAGEWSVRVLPIDGNGALSTEPREAGFFSPGGNIGRRARSDENGHITLFPLQVGRYRVFVAPRVSIGEGEEAEATSVDVTVPAGGATASLRVVGAPGKS